MLRTFCWLVGANAVVGKTVYQTAVDAGLDVLVAAIDAAGFKSVLNNPNFRGTVFAPTDEAFAILLEQLGVEAEDLLDDKKLLQDVLNYHVIPDDRITTSSLETLQTWGTNLGDTTLALYKSPKGTVRVYYGEESVTRTNIKWPGSAKIIPGLRNIKADKAIVQVIDRVLIP